MSIIKSMRTLKRMQGLWLAACLFFISTTTHAYSQNTSPVAVEARNQPIAQVLRQIEKQTGYSFSYATHVLDGSTPVTISLKKVPLPEALNMLLNGRNVGWTMNNRTIVLVNATSKTPLDTIPQITVTGRVTGPDAKPIAGATVAVKGTSQGQSTDGEGRFRLPDVAPNATLVITSLGFNTHQFKANGQTNFNIVLEPQATEIKAIEVLSTGYQSIPKERATGSFTKIDNELLNRRVSTNVLDRLDGVASGVFFNRNRQSAADPLVQVRGRSTIFANAEPLIVLDNFPYEGDINSINPNDIASITILKDAAAASIWGVRASNGVIVITSKSGALNKEASVSFNANVTFGNKPDLYYQPQLSAGEFLEVEDYLFNQGAYDFYLDFPSFAYYPLSPAVEIMDKRRKGLISAADADAQLNTLKNTDARRNHDRFFQQQMVNQQYALNVTGGGVNNRYYLSGGYDHNKGNAVGTSMERFTFNGNNTQYLLKKKLEIGTKVFFTSTKTTAANIYAPKLPYENIRSTDGSALAAMAEQRLSYADTAGSGRLLDWHYYPLQERKPVNYTRSYDYRFDAGISYTIIDGLKAAVLYQFNRSTSDGEVIYRADSYFTRNLVNRYTQVDPLTNTLLKGIPEGQIYSQSALATRGHYGRGTLTYDKLFNGVHQVNVLAGMEVRTGRGNNNSQTLYGYDPATAVAAQIDYYKDYMLYDLMYTSRVNYANNRSGTVDKFRSVFANAAYTFDNRYTLSGSLRSDESNLFGVAANQRRVPLWSAGLSWNIAGEKFYNNQLFPILKLRASNGFNGNVDRTLSAYITANATSQINFYGLPVAVIVNPPNPQLRWEKVNVTNIGVDFGMRENILSGTIEYFVKSGKDLIGNAPVAPQTGNTQFKGNVANMRTNGLDVTLNSVNINRKFKWTSNFLLSYVKDKITGYKVKQGSNGSYVTANYTNPLEGRPYSALFSFPWAGLDTLGLPQFYLDGKKSSDYSAINRNTDISNLKYEGPAAPTFFGSLRNNFSYAGITLSANITYATGYYFRRQSIDYGSLVGGNYRQADYANRWKMRGDEAKTDVPAIYYYPNPTRESLYNNASILIEKGDHIRLQDVQASYDLPNAVSRKLGLSYMKCYIYANNLGILWRANGRSIDPGATTLGSYPTPATFAVGINTTF